MMNIYAKNFLNNGIAKGSDKEDQRLSAKRW
jgi:hypothetical protein